MKKKEPRKLQRRKVQPKRKQVTKRILYNKRIRLAELELNRRFQKSIKRKTSFKTRISRQTRAKKQIPLKEIPSQRIRRSLTKQFKQKDRKPYYSYIMAITLNPTITINGLSIAIEEAEKRLKRNFPELKVDGSYIAPEYQQLTNSEEIQLNDYRTYIMAFVLDERGDMVKVLDYTK